MSSALPSSSTKLTSATVDQQRASLPVLSPFASSGLIREAIRPHCARCRFSRHRLRTLGHTHFRTEVTYAHRLGFTDHWLRLTFGSRKSGASYASAYHYPVSSLLVRFRPWIRLALRLALAIIASFHVAFIEVF